MILGKKGATCARHRRSRGRRRPESTSEGDTNQVRSAAQASRTNGARSRGPKTPTGKNVSKINGLVHGLRAEQVVLPGEDPAEFEAERKGWFDDWKPQSRTPAPCSSSGPRRLVAAPASVRVETARLRKLAMAAGRRFDARRPKLRRGIALFDDVPEAAWSSSAPTGGLDQLIAAVDGLLAALASPGGWQDSTGTTSG